MSACLFHVLTAAAAAACGGFADVGPAGMRCRSIAVAATFPAARRSVANANSVTLSADVGS